MIEGLVSLSEDCREFSLQDMQAPQPGEVSMASRTGGDPVHCGQALAQPCVGIGIMVLSSTCKTLYANQSASEFLKVLNRWEHGHATDGALPGAIAGLYDRLEPVLARRVTQGDGERLEARRLITGEGRTVRLNAFGLYDRLGMRESRVVITMQTLSHAAICDEISEAIAATS